MLADNDRLLAAEREQTDAMAQLLANESAYVNGLVVVKAFKERVDGSKAMLTAEFLRAGNSASAAGTYAEADPRHISNMKKFLKDLHDGQAAIVRHGLLLERLACAREVMANERKRMGL